MKDEALKLALDALEGVLDDSPKVLDASISGGLYEVVQCRDAITAIKAALAAQPAPVQEPVVWMWQQAPIKTQWGDEMVVAALAIDRDHTVSIYCERDQTAKVEAMFTPPAAQRQWVGLTEEERTEIRREHYARTLPLMDAIEAKLRSKNT